MTQNQPGMTSLLDEMGAEAPAQSRALQGRGGLSEGRKQQIFAIATVVLLLAAIATLAYQALGGGPSAAAIASVRDVMDSESNQVILDFEPPKTAPPWTNPKTGRATLYLAERCFWTKDGKAKLEPTYVIPNEAMDKPGDAICPDCGRKVIRHNPSPPPELLEQAARDAGNKG